MRVLVSAASRHGATAEIAAAIAASLSERGLQVELLEPTAVRDVERYDAVVLGSAVYTGHWLAEAKALVGQFGPALARRPVWLFSSGPVGDPARKLVAQMGADPVDLPEIARATRAREHHVFAGRLRRGDLSPLQRLATRVVRGLEGDFRDWEEIDAWSAQIAAGLATPAHVHAGDGG